MPRTRSIAWSELKVGVVAVIALILVVAIVFAVGGGGGFWWQRYPLRTRFADAQGLKSGAVVRVSGKEVGTVTRVDLSGAGVEVGLELLKDVRPLVTTDSSAEIGSLSLLGEPIVDITASQTGTPLQDNEYVKAGFARGAIASLTTTASTSLGEIEKLLADVRAGKGTLGKLVTDDALYAELQSFVSSAAAVTDAINRGKGTLGGLVQDPAVLNSLKASLQNLETMTAKINTGQGALGRFLNDEALGKSIAASASNIEQLTGKLNRGEGTAGKLLTDKELWDRLNSMTTRIDSVVSGLESGKGTAGKLLQDQQLYENMNHTVVELRDLLDAVRKDPQKYLRVRVSIF